VNPVLALAIGLAGGILIGRQMSQCQAAAGHATKTDVALGLVGLGQKAFNYFTDDDGKD
jgi:hypothetical protein